MKYVAQQCMKKKATPNSVAEENNMALRWLLLHDLLHLLAFGFWLCGGAKGRSEERSTMEREEGRAPPQVMWTPEHYYLLHFFI
jgi:hypothetical protein